MTKTYILDSVTNSVTWPASYGTSVGNFNAVVSGGTSATGTLTVPSAVTRLASFTTSSTEPNDASWSNTVGAYHFVIDISSIGADITLTSATQIFNKVLTGASSIRGAASGDWDTTTGTGLHTATNTAGYSGTGGATSDRYGLLLTAANASMMSSEDIVLNLGTSTEFADGPWTVTITATAADSISTLTESPSRVATNARTVSESISSVTEAVVASRLFLRTVADSLSTLTEAATRVLTKARSAADTLAGSGGIFDSGIFDSGIFDMGGSGITESVARVLTAARTGADSLSSITEAVVASKNAISVTVADSISTLTESVNRALTASRTVAASISSLTEAVTRTVTTPRTVADSLSSLTEAVVAIKSVIRTMADSLSAISETVSRSGGFLRGLSDLLVVIREWVTGAAPFNPAAPTVVDLTIDGVSVWSDVLYEKAHFESQVNGVAGSCSFRVRDENRTLSFADGDPILLTINGRNVWRGFVATVTRVYVFPALDIDEFGLARFIDITGTDINVLFTKRFVFKQSDPATVMAPLLPAHTPDVTAIDQLLAGWLDLSGDGLNTTTFVDNVGDTTWTQEGRAWEGSDSWGQAMQSIGSIPAAIYYIDPDKNFVYTDVDTPTAPFKLSDQPDHVTSFGYREMEVLADGTALANDVMCWGMGYGSQTPVFVRDEDSASLAEHGRWQLGQTSFGVYKQSTINRIADSIINGSPQSKRGAKNDRPAVMVTTYQNGLRVADKVDFTSNVFGYNDVIPIRKMEVEFPAPDSPKYMLTLSHEIDTPFSFFDPFLFDFHLPTFCPPGYIANALGDCVPIPLPEPLGCADSLCGTTDTYTRTVTGDWGRSDALIDWVTTLGGGSSGTFSVDGTTGLIALPASTNDAYCSLPVGGLATEFTIGAQLTSSSTASTTYARFGLDFNGYNSFIEVDFACNGLLTLSTDTGNTTTTLSFNAKTAFNVRAAVRGNVAYVRVWRQTDPEPATWDLTATIPTLLTSTDDFFTGASNASVALTAAFDNLSVIDYSLAAASGTPVSTGSGGDIANGDTSVGYAYTIRRIIGAAPVFGSSGDTVTADSVPLLTSTLDDINDGTINNGEMETRNYVGFLCPPGVTHVRLRFLLSAGVLLTPIQWGLYQGTWGAGAPTFDGSLGDVLASGSLAAGGSAPYGNTANVDVTIPAGWNGEAQCVLIFQSSHVLVNSTNLAFGAPGIDSRYPSMPAGRRSSEQLGTYGTTHGLGSAYWAHIDYLAVPAYAPLVNRCIAVQFDNFERTVASDSWGTATAGFMWHTFGPGTATRSVSGGFGKFLQNDPGTVPNQHGNASVYDDTSTAVWGADFDMTAEFQIVALPDSAHTGTLAQWAVALSAASPFDGTLGQFVLFAKRDNAHSGNDTVTVGTTTITSPVTFTAGSTYRVRWTKTGATHAVRVWLASAVEPAMPNVSATVTPITPLSFAVWQQQPFTRVFVSDPNATLEIDWQFINFDYTGRPCYPAGPPPGTGVPSNSWGCEQFDVVTTTLTLAHPFLANSAQVWKNGLLQSQTTYTENPTAGTITFDSVPSPTDNARVCYWALP